MSATMVFVHVPKTGGMSVFSALSKLFAPTSVCSYYEGLPASFHGMSLVSSHDRLIDLEKVDGDKMLITTIRKPIQRVKSLFRFWKSHRLEHCVGNGRMHLLQNKYRSFEEFLLASEGEGGLRDNEMVRHFADVRPEAPCTEADLVAALENISRCAAVLRMEHLEEDLQGLFSAVNSEKLFELTSVNITDGNVLARPGQYEAVEDVDFAELSSSAVQALYNLTYLDARLYEQASNMAQHKKKSASVFKDLAVKRYDLTRGEVVYPCKDQAFLTMLANGWADLENETIWSVASEASLKFKVDGGTDDPAQLVLEFNTCMVTNRRYCIIDVVYGKQKKKVLFLQQGVVIEGGAALKANADMICVAPSPARVKINLENDRGEDHVHTVSFRMAAGTASPMMLQHNQDARPLGVKLISMELV